MTQAGAAHFRAAVRRLRHALPVRRLLAAKFDIKAAYRQLIYDRCCRELLPQCLKALERLNSV